MPSPEQILAQLAQRPGLAGLLERLGADTEPLPRVLLVGGVVRDLLLAGPASVDVDLVVEGPLDRVLERFAGAVRPHHRFGTATLSLDGTRVDIAEARTETYAHPGALPDVAPATAERDLARRDFTVNAIAVELTGPRRGAILAAPGALDDLEHRRLSVLHDRSFIDDPTRLLRLVRYRSRLGFDIGAHTLELARGAIAGGALDTVSGTRVGNELRLLAAEPDPVTALTALSDLRLDAALEPTFGLAASGADGAATLTTALAALPQDGRRDLLALATASLAVPEAQLLKLLDRLGFTAADRNLTVEAASRAPEIAAALGGSERPSQIADTVGASAPEAVALASALASGMARQNALRWLTELRQARLEITGNDLVDAGIAPGPAVGAALKAARAALLDGEAPDRERQLRVAIEATRDDLG